MTSIEIGDVVIAAEGERLTIRRRGEPVVRIDLDGEGLNELLDFLRSVRVDRQNRRRGFRVPIITERFRTQLGGSMSSIEVRARDVSLSGIFIEFPRGVPEIEVNDELEISIDYGNDATVLSGLVSRVTDEGVGVVFEHAANTRSPTPPATFARIVMLLEREWLRARLES